MKEKEEEDGEGGCCGGGDDEEDEENAGAMQKKLLKLTVSIHVPLLLQSLAYSASADGGVLAEVGFGCQGRSVRCATCDVRADPALRD